MAALLLVPISFSILEYSEYGLDYSWITKTVNPQAYSGGFHYLGFCHSFLKFPRTIQTIEFSEDPAADQGMVLSRTLDGLEVILSISFQYKLVPERLFEVFSNYGMDYQQILISVAIDSLTDMATKYSAYDFFMYRGRIGN